MDTDRFAPLRAELAAIELWDRYYHTNLHNKIDDDAYLSRQGRRQQILSEILSKARPDPRSFLLKFLKRFPLGESA
jgi:hypothetical protein